MVLSRTHRARLRDICAWTCGILQHTPRVLKIYKKKQKTLTAYGFSLPTDGQTDVMCSLRAPNKGCL